MHKMPIKRSYMKMMLLLCSTGFFVPIYSFIGISLQRMFDGPFIAFSILGYMLTWLTIVLSQYNKYNIFYGIYRKWKKSENEAEKETLGVITFKDIRALKKLKQDRKTLILRNKAIPGFSIVKNGSLGCVFYSNEKIHTYVYVVILDSNHLITIPLMFDSSVHFKILRFNKPNVIKLFLHWADDNSVRIEHLQLYNRGRSYDPEEHRGCQTVKNIGVGSVI